MHLYDGNLGKTFSLLIRVKLAGGVKDAYTNKTVVIVTMIIVIMIVTMIALTDPTPERAFQGKWKQIETNIVNRSVLKYLTGTVKIVKMNDYRLFIHDK